VGLAFNPRLPVRASLTRSCFEPPTYRLRADCYYCPKYALRHIFQAELQAHFMEVLNYLKVFALKITSS